MDVVSSSNLSIRASIPTNKSYATAPEVFDKSIDKPIREAQQGVQVSISAEAKEKNDAALNQDDKTLTDKKDFGESLRAENSILNPSENEDNSLSLEEKLDQRIDEVKEKIKDVQKEIQALRADGGEKSEEKIKILDQKVQALYGELNSLMEQKLELMK